METDRSAPLWLLSLSILTVFLLYFLQRISGRRHGGAINLPPGPHPLPIVGSLHKLGTHPHRSLAALAETYGPVMSLRLGQIMTIVVSSPAAAREVLQKHDRHLSSRSVPEAVRILGHDRASVVWTDSSTKHWKHLRSVYRAHLLSTENLDAGRKLRQQKVAELIAHVRGHAGTRAVDVGRAAFATILNLVSSTAFSADMVDINSESAQEFKDLVWGIMEEVGAPNLSDFFPALGFLDVQGHRRRTTAHFKRLIAIFDRIIDQRLRAKETDNNTHHDLLESLLHLHIQDGGMDRQTIKSVLADVFIAGTDTVSITVEWAMAELLRSPAAMEKAKAELATAVVSVVEEDDLSKLPFLQAVVNETLRLHPPGPLLIPHRAEVSVEVCGYTVPEGSRVLVNAWAIGRDGEAWEEAEAFVPERFVGRDVDFRGGHFELIPFGSGRRMCPGLPLAWRSVHLMLAALLREFEWRLPEGMAAGDVDVGEKFGVTLAKAVPLRAFAI